MPESFGARLRRRREELGVALDTVVEQTKIKRSLLEALEHDDVSHWPSGIFRRAFIRAYAQAIGLEPDVVLREFLEVHGERPEIAVTGWAEPAADAGVASAGPRTRLRYMVDSAIESLSRRRRAAAVNGPVAADGVAADGVAAYGVAANGGAADAPVTMPSASEADRQAMDAGPPAIEPPTGPDFLSVAHLCTALAQVERIEDLQRLLREVCRVLDARGLILWVWDARTAELKPALVHGYSERVLAQLPAVGRDADNATAAAFRSAQPCTTSGTHHANGALVLPLLTSAGCAGVLALELPHGSEQTTAVRAAATILTALLSQLVAAPEPADARGSAPLRPAAAGSS